MLVFVLQIVITSYSIHYTKLYDLEKAFPGLKERICDESGQIRRFINVFVNGEDIRFKEGAKTSVAEGAEVSIIPAIAGG